ncbi:hypothetical protein CORC01_10900, partial [Colletotrichum orchidophilum]
LARQSRGVPKPIRFRAAYQTTPSFCAACSAQPIRCAQIFLTNASLPSRRHFTLLLNLESSLTCSSPFASNKSASPEKTPGPNFSHPSITLSDVGPDPGPSSTGQGKPTLHLVFCGCRVLMLVGPDPRSPALFSSPSPLLSLPSSDCSTRFSSWTQSANGESSCLHKRCAPDG